MQTRLRNSHFSGGMCRNLQAVAQVARAIVRQLNFWNVPAPDGTAWRPAHVRSIFDAEGRVSHHFLRNALQFAVLMASVFFLIVAGRDGAAKSEWVQGE